MQIYIIGSEQTELNEVKLLLNKKSRLLIVGFQIYFGEVYKADLNCSKKRTSFSLSKRISLI